MLRKGKKAPLIAAIIAGIALIALLLAGTILRMQAREISFAQAFSSFVSDTF